MAGRLGGLLGDRSEAQSFCHLGILLSLASKPQAFVKSTYLIPVRKVIEAYGRRVLELVLESLQQTYLLQDVRSPSLSFRLWSLRPSLLLFCKLQAGIPCGLSILHRKPTSSR